MSTARLREIEAKIFELTPSDMVELAAEPIQRARQAGLGAQTIPWSRFQGSVKQGPEPLDY